VGVTGNGVKQIENSDPRSRGSRTNSRAPSALTIIRYRGGQSICRQLIDCRRFKCRRWHSNRGRHRDQNAQSLGVDEEERLVLLDRAAERSRPLVGVGERLRIILLVIEPVIGVHGRAVPVINGIAVELVAAGLGNVVHVHAGEGSEVAGISVGDDVCFLDFVRAQEEVGSARVAQVQEGIVVVHSVESKEVRSAWHSVRFKVAVAALRICDYAGSKLRRIRQIIAGVGNLRNLLLRQRRADVAILRFDEGRNFSDRDRRAAAGDSETNAYHGRRAQRDINRLLGGLEPGSRHGNRVIRRQKQVKRIDSGRIRCSRLRRALDVI